MRLFLKRLLAYVPTKLPVGMTEMTVWMDSIIELSGQFADQDSMRFAIASILIHADSSKGALPKHYFISRLRKSAANQVASQVFQDIKTKQQEAQAAAAAKPVEATTQPSVVANETPPQN